MSICSAANVLETTFTGITKQFRLASLQSHVKSDNNSSFIW
jgi:hypothetical protein